MRNLRHIFILFFSLFLIGTNYILAQDVIKPDFAYPKQVIKQSENDLNKAIKDGNSKDVIKSLINYSVAQDLINNDSIQNTISKIEQIIEIEKEPCNKALLNTLLLKIYSDIYRSNVRTISNREKTGAGKPSDINEWSKTDFIDKITDLCNKILLDEDILKRSKLKNYENIVTGNDLTYTFYPTLYDFAVYQVINVQLSISEHLAPIARATNYDVFLQSNTKYYNSTLDYISTLYNKILSFHINDTAPFINWEISRLNTFNRYSQNSTNNGSSILSLIDALNYLYKKHENSEYATMALMEIYNIGYDKIYSTREIHQLFSNRIYKFPTYFGNNQIKNVIFNLEQKSLKLKYNKIIIPNDSLTIHIENTNNKNYTIEILHLPDNVIDKLNSYYTYSYPATKLNQYTVYQKFNLTCDSTIPFSEKRSVSTTITNPGLYTIIAYSDSIERNGAKQNILRCTNLFITRSEHSNNTENRIWVLNPKTGSPITDANIDIYKLVKNKFTFDQSFKSTKDGKSGTRLSPNFSYLITAKKGNDDFTIPQRLNNNEPTEDEIELATLFTDLPIYHPGDTVNWSAVVYQNNYNKKELIRNKTYTISFRDANYIEIDTAIVTTDCYGRIEGKFQIPIDRLTGNYSINIIGKFNRELGFCNYTVSDYKLPTFNITINNICHENNNYTITGKVNSFSGFALENTSINLNILYQERFYSNNSISLYKATTTSNNNGYFSFTVTDSIFFSSLPNAIYNAEITATTTNGESQTSSKYFTGGNQYQILVNFLTDEIFEVKETNKLDVLITTIDNKNVDGDIHYYLSDTNKRIVKHGSFNTNNPIVDWSDLQSGKYNISLYSIAPTTSDTTSIDIRLYRISDPLPPCDEGIWLQHDKYLITKDNSIEIVYGAAFNSGDILYLLYDNDTIYEQRWIKTKAGIHKTRVFLPQNINNAKIVLYSINNYKTYECSATITRSKSIKTLNITAESFRDKIVPESEEVWKFRVSDNSGNGKESAMILNMYSLAIDKLKKHRFSLSFPSNDIPNILLSYFLNNTNNYLNYSKIPTLQNYNFYTTPQINTYNHYFGNKHRGIIAYGSSIKSNNTLRASNTELSSVRSTKIDNLEDVAYEESSTDGSTYLNTESINNSFESSNIALRENESPLAFFRPMLTTDTLGNLTFSFTAPNANTTWLFNAIAFNEDMVAADFAHKVIANKPIMVQPNMPRFLRNGDNAIIKATVMNNSDSIMAITTIIELFNPSTAKVISTHSQIDTINTAQSATASIEIKAPTNASMIGYRIKSFGDNFGDGEQSLIPILPATSPIIESTTFYLGTNERSYTQQLPAIPMEAKVTLEFCENPTWYAVTALPGLSKNQSRTSISAAIAIYSAAIADGIVRQNPQIANAIYQWQHSDKSDSTLVSMLSRNQDLKNILLSATPWVQNAENDTERMARLSLLFDKKELKSTLDKNIHLLATLQRNGGGWAWIAESDEASTWATLSILEKLGHLKKLGFLPDNDDIHTMIKNAITYIDSYFTQQHKKYPKNDYGNYVLIRNFFSEYKQSTAASKVTTSTIQQIISNWRNYSLEKKATSAIILNNHNYNSTAREILKSISEFSQTTPSRGMWWPSIENSNAWNIDKIRTHTIILDAYVQITPSNNDIDKMRQWLIINKEANDWGNSSATSYVIYTLLNSGSRWTSKVLGSEITLGGETIPTSHFDNITGYLHTDISTMAPSDKKLSIAKHGNQPAWGAVYRQYNATMSNIKAVAGNDISIEKKTLKLNADGSKWIEAQEFNIGDKVRIQLTIKASRNIEYITITDERAACFEPSEQLPKPIFAEGIYFYRENRDDATNIFVTNLPKGTYLISYDMYVNNEGEFSSGIATIQSQYAPQITAHSAGNTLNIFSK